MVIDNFPRSIWPRIGHYVYVYRHPITRKVFYVGRGQGDRVFAHLSSEPSSAKGKIIAALRNEGREPLIELVVHSLSDDKHANSLLKK
jgi:hypothetical protein